MFIKPLIMLASIAAGMMVAFQSPINHKLGSIMGTPLTAAFLSFAVGTLLLGLALLATGQPIKITDIGKTEFYMWLGGLLGAVFVFTSINAVPILGSALMLSLFILGQLIGALIIDKTGFLLPLQIDISWQRIAALGLILSGVVLFTREF